ncbi:MAG: Zn-ribbon domain-containing OB-fold protein [Myxococcota bacterium]
MTDDMTAYLWETVQSAIAHHCDETARTFYARLRERKLSTTRCDGCGTLSMPPRPFCPACAGADASRGGGMSWVDLSGRGTLHAFSQNHQALFFGKPDVIGLVDLEEGCGRILSRIDAPIETLRIDQPLVVDFLELSENLVLHQFRPASSAPARP